MLNDTMTILNRILKQNHIIFLTLIFAVPDVLLVHHMELKSFSSVIMALSAPMTVAL